MYINKDKNQARADRIGEIEAIIQGTYMRNNRMASCPIDAKSLKEITEHIASAYITMTQYDYGVIKESMKVISKSENLSKEQKKTLKQLFDKIKLFAE